MAVSHVVSTTTAGGMAVVNCSCGSSLTIPGGDASSAALPQMQAFMSAHSHWPMPGASPGNLF